MDRNELLGIGDASLRKALADMFTILNGKGEILVKIGGDDDSMAFSPNLRCDKDCSVMLFDDEDKAQGVIDDILVPQDDGEYSIFKFSSIDDEGCEDYDDDECCNCIDDEFDDEDCVCDDDTECCDSSSDDGEMSLDDAIEHARETGAKLLSEDPECECGKEHMQLAKWLEELRSIRGANGEDNVQESDSSKEKRRILKRNGYQLISQKDSKECWKKDEDEPITLPYGEDVDESVWSNIVKERGLVTKFED